MNDATALDHLPAELLDLIRDQTATKILDAVSEAALIPSLTERIWVHFEAAFPDICARWILNSGNGLRTLKVASSLARILPFAPYLSTFLEQPPTDPASSGRPPQLHLPLPEPEKIFQSLDQKDILEYLVTLWRLTSFDVRRFGRHIPPALLQSLFTHPSRPIRYVAIRIFCQLLHASDHKLETLVEEHVGKSEAVSGDLDGISIDYGFLTLHEHTRVRKAIALREKFKTETLELGGSETEVLHSLTPYVASYGQVLLPRPFGPTGDPSSLVLTDTTTENLEGLAQKLKIDKPVLLHGSPGVGKTSLVHEIAKELGMYSGMVTLHLNEQTDAKMLIGLYSTDSKPGSFQWRPGILTTAVKEGRWVLIEDLDRAPTEVLSTLLPLIERNELLVPSRGERIRAASTFRLFATLRTSRGMNGRENLPSIVGMRFWQSMQVQSLSESELEQVVLKTYPVLRKYVPGILAVYNRLSRLGRNPSLAAGGRSILDRQLSPRDLLKWCRRLQQCLSTAGSTSGEEPISEITRDWMFMEALDCFVGNCADHEMSKKLVYAIGEEMHLSPERADHYLSAYIPPLEETDNQFSIGRTRLRKQRLSNRVQKSKRAFASTAHAKKLLEQIATAVKLSEPVLLVGETGIGKTTVVQQLAESLGHRLFAVNLSQQSEVGDLLGGFKPVNVRTLAVPLKEEFEDLFAATGISVSKNQKYFEQVGKSFAKSQWSKVSKLWKEAPKMFTKIVSDLERAHSQHEEPEAGDAQQPAKRRKTQSKLQSLLDLRPRWDAFSRKLEQFDVQVSGGGSSLAFAFMEGNLVKAVRNGDWVLLDEINLASPDTLESIAELLADPGERPSILLSETGEIEKIVAHPNFRIFGAMNPATDIGKRDLPTGIRSRFTELYVRSPDADLKDLLTIIKTYLGTSSSKHDQAADDIARLYLNTKRLAAEKRIVDGANEVPHFSLRTLTRVLSYVNTIAPLYGLRRALYEGFSMGFLTLLDRDSEQMLVPLIQHHLFEKQGNGQSLLSQAPKHPSDGKQYVKFKNKNQDRQYWLFQGNEPVVERDDYIITPYVERNLLNLVRATSTRRFPILIQGPTSAGKTSMIEYLAHFTGNKFVRINNHEHTDLQEYLGTYVSGTDGKLRFQEGLLVQAMRQGHWMVLDELNLAPTDVLEALNRLLDDNRELLIPETQEVVRPHENFILFATQNPPGLYGGRKVLSRAFRNRFLELHFDDIPEDELEFILQQRSHNTSPPDCRRIVTVYKELSRLRQTSRLFEQKDSFATLRDLFRWALRDAESREEIAAHGFMLLAERVRNEEERMAVKDVIEKVFKVKVDPQEIYSSEVAPELKQISAQGNSQGVVWTHAMRRLYVLVARALRNNEPVLLVGETGCGKTTVCQLLAEALQKELHIVNAHQNTETGDLIGSQRPIRNRGAILEALDADLKVALASMNVESSGTVGDRIAKYKSAEPSVQASIPAELRERIISNETRSKALFEWSDGALVEAMKDGQFFLLDEISLADDSVLERLNSVLEPQRTLLLAEKGIDNSFVVASQGFQLFATMNPGGDFGKKELSPALRNRFTEIWVPPLSESEDIYDIVRTKLSEGCKDLVEAIVQFATWFGETFRSTSSTRFSIREILVWVHFINKFKSNRTAALVHGASTIFIDSIGANPSAILAGDGESISQQRAKCLAKLGELVGQDVSAVYQTEPDMTIDETSLTIGDFSIPREASATPDPGFAFHAPTTRLNGMRVLRALQMQKPILLEGSPGVGKTTLVAALARACGQPLTRINLSDQTDLMDLFGTDVPVEGEEAGNFAWRDAPFLQAMQKGEWVLLDEMNLASQSVLEGLNACLDHRGEVYISELDQVFKRHPDFRLFAAQNPHHQGGGRKGLPSSFVNRFVVVYADVFSDEDLQLIATHNFPLVPADVINQLIQFISRIEHALVTERSFGSQGGPWEFNLRDVLRWLQLLSSSDDLLRAADMGDFIDLVVRQRFRSQKDRNEVNRLFSEVTGSTPRVRNLYHNISSLQGQVGLALINRTLDLQPESLPGINIVPRLPELETIMICVKKNIPCILSSPSGHGKSVLLEHVAALSGKPLVVFPMNADIDTMDLVGGFEQADPLREVNATFVSLRENLQRSIMSIMPAQVPAEALQLLHLLESFHGNADSIKTIQSSIEALAETVAADSEVGKLLRSALELVNGPLMLTNPRFEWLDGVIVKALLTGQWLVLDNANLCNASVLDRLNSLLEPNGFLSINEHCEPGGEPQIITPHPEFRIFLTTDPRYGELSRAMRNRAVEVYIESPSPSIDPAYRRISPIESGLQRFKTVEEATQQENPPSTVAPEEADTPTDVLSMSDLSMLQRIVDDASLTQADGDTSRDSLSRKLLFLRSSNGSKILADVAKLYSQLSESTAPGILQSQVSINSFAPDVCLLISWQPIHPLVNYPASQLLPDVRQAEWLAVRYEFSQNLHQFERRIESFRQQAQGKKLSSLNRFERSLIKDRVAAVSKDSTANLLAFSTSVAVAMTEYLTRGPTSPDSWKVSDPNIPSPTTNLILKIQDACGLVRLVERYLHRTVSLAIMAFFDEAKFQAHLAYGGDVFRSRLQQFGGESEASFIGLILEQMKRDFTAGFKLSTGLSMEILWKTLRPTPCRDENVLASAMALEQLAARFDFLRWRSSASVKDLCNASETIEKAYSLVKTADMSTEGLIQDLTAAIVSLEGRIGNEAPENLPVFADEFEILRQLNLLSRTGPSLGSSRELLILSNTPTKASIMPADPATGAATLQEIAFLACQDRFAWDGRLSLSLWSKLQNIGAVSLNSLALLETELPILGRHLASLTSEVATDPLNHLNKALWELILQVFEAHGELLKNLANAAFSNAVEILAQQPQSLAEIHHLPSFVNLIEGIDTPHLREITTDNLIPAIASLAAAQHDLERLSYYSSLAWNHFSVAAIRLYIPDRVFDPQIRPQMEREFFEDHQSHLKYKIEALRVFERGFTGQDTNARIELLYAELDSLGPLPQAVQPVYRPEKSELSRLHAEFTNILKAAENVDLPSGAQFSKFSFTMDSDKLRLIRENLQRLIERLSHRYEAYQDITQPTIGLLRCLLIGLSLCESSNAKSLSEPTSTLLQASPFFGGSLTRANDVHKYAKGFELLDVATLAVSVQGVENLHTGLREAIFECFHTFYEDWNKKLEIDKKAEAEKRSLYRFRGSAEDEDELDAEEFNELFPVYDDESTEKPVSKPRDQVRDTSVKVAKIHRNLFLQPLEPSYSISQLVHSAGQGVVNETTQEDYVDRSLNKSMLPSTLLLLQEKKHMLSSSDTETSYNFYVDQNLAEARLIVSLVNKIKARFRELQQVDEIGHMQPLADVVSACDKLLEVVHTEPLASILPKVEQLHAYVYEWQFGGWASRVHAVLELHNALTDSVIRWRRLELSTWSKLFDMEQAKCEDDAYSWWFVAYQVVIAVPLSMVDSPEELRVYATSLIENLELYFSTSIVGQFSTRLSLLKQLRNYLKLLSEDYPALNVIHHSIVNFVDFYSRFERAATETIQREKAPIDKKMKDVLLMASWKDTNINALRDSARRSHQKLFRLVRKFRGVLGQQIKKIIEQGLPDEKIAESKLDSAEAIAEVPEPSPTSVVKLAGVLPNWLEQNKRLANAPKTVTIMSQVSQSPEMTTGIPAIIDSFVSELTTSMAELRKETPQHLTDDNKEQVKYLKTRKRKLFADTLKNLRQMGIRYNLSQDRLAEQESLAIILASGAPIDFPSSVVDSSVYYFHKLLDLAPNTRAAVREHSEELTSAEVARSVGFVEGMIHLLLEQRRGLNSATGACSGLAAATEKFRAIGKENENRDLVRKSTSSNHSMTLPWLINVLEFAIRLVEIHGGLGGNSHEIVVEDLRSWASRFSEQLHQWRQLPELPEHIVASTRLELDSQCCVDLQAFTIVLDQTATSHPNLAFILDEVRLWSKSEVVDVTSEAAIINFTGYANNVSRLCDKILVAVEAARKAGLSIPRDEEQAGWLTKHNEAFHSMVKQLHMKDVTRSVLECVDTLTQVDLAEPGASLAVMGVTQLAVPILEKFSAIGRQSVNHLLDIHRATAQMAYHLTKSFTQISSQGFCTPQEESDETSGDSGKVESGTGLGEGEAAEDISKDIQDDEDLTELAQEANKEEKGEIEDEKDAVDMADEELEGELGSVDGEDDDEDGSKNGDEEEDKEMDEEAGDVDDLDPTAVDEKMWDGEDEEKAEKDQQGDKPKGQQKDDEQIAADDDTKHEETEQDTKNDDNNEKNPEEEEEADGEAEQEQEDVQAQDELNKQEQTAQENDTLALPDEMELDFDEGESASSDSDDLDAASEAREEEKPEEQEAGKGDEDDAPVDSAAQEKDADENMDEEDVDEPEDEAPTGQDEVQDEVKPEEEEETPDETKDEAPPPPTDNTTADKDNTAPSDVKSSGLDQQGEAMDLDDEFQDSAAQQDEGETGEGAADKEASAGNKGSTSRAEQAQDIQEQADDQDDNTEARSDPFKKLGDALEKWHRQQSDIKEANPEDNAEEKREPDGEQSRREFQHLQNDDAAVDAQAMGTADEDEAQPIDESMAIDEKKQDRQSRLMEEDAEEDPENEIPDKDNQAESAEAAADKESKEADDVRSGVQTRQGNYNREHTPTQEEAQMEEDEDKSDSVEETSTQLSTTHISGAHRQMRDFGECMQQWVEFQSKTHALSLSLTSQLRLILTPSQSTKLSGSFRTGKRLNIKRIIPYIASSYKRDKIWMRRSIPTKRTYQILLCVDDSKSMGESSSGTLAMESLVMVSRSLTMLEAGQVGVVGFGSEVFTAHNLADPFAADAGAKVLQNFNFSQDRTDIALLIRQTIDTFRLARQQSGGNSDLWQLSLILSDGLTPSSAHDNIRRLLREAIEERIMIVFIIMDDTGKKKGDSVLELKEAKFVKENGESRVVIERYLDTFPFQYYLIVHHLEELPSALAGLLRTWFAEVAS